MEKIELLAPAGNKEAFYAAVENGADAVYIGGKQYSARASAHNFELSDILEITRYAHIKGVNIYLTINTLLHDSEIEKAAEFAKNAHSLGVDALIIQDYGLLPTISGIPIHASTQMTIRDLEGAQLLSDMGFSRIILARELSQKEIIEITKNCSAETEIFVHGALCVSYSGRCLMSSMIGGRSGNRGACAQPCRQPYELVDLKNKGGKSNTKKYYLSMKDLCLLERLDALISLGVKSLKIEGRLKSPEYVAAVVSVYRKYIDLAYEYKRNGNPWPPEFIEDDLEILRQVFCRGFTCGHYGRASSRMISSNIKPKHHGIKIGHVIYYDKAKRNIIAEVGEGELEIGDGIEVWNGGNSSPGTIVSYISKAGRDPNRLRIGDIEGNIKPGMLLYRTSRKSLLKKLKESYSCVKNNKHMRQISISTFFKGITGDKAKLVFADGVGNEHEVFSATKVTPAITRPIEEKTVLKQISSLGETPYKIDKAKVEVSPDAFISVSEINRMRREAAEGLTEKRLASWNANRIRQLRGQTDKKALADNLRNFVPFVPEGNVSVNFNTQKPFINFIEYCAEGKFDLHNSGLSYIGLPADFASGSAVAEAIDYLFTSSVPLFLSASAAVSLKDLTEGILEKAKGIIIENAGALAYAYYLEKVLWAGPGMNIYNSSAISYFSKLGINGGVFSYEIDEGEAADIDAKQHNIREKESFLTEFTVYGRTPVMDMAYCPVAVAKRCTSDCSSCESCRDAALKDSYGEVFPLHPIKCINDTHSRSVLYHSRVRKIDIKNSILKYYRLDIFDESPSAIKGLIEKYRRRETTEA